MKQFILIFLMSLSFTQLIALPRGLRGGAGDGAGGDNKRPETGSAWFLGTDTVKYCTVIDPKFGEASDMILPEVRESFRLWREYVELHSLDNEGRSDSRLNIAINSKYHEKCDGTEDITFYFGGTNEEIEKAKAQFDKPVGFANRSAYDLKKGWGKGFIWVAGAKSIHPDTSFPDWSKPYLLHGILLHEMGHVYGCQHVQGTVMSESIAQYLELSQSSTKMAYALLNEIDNYRTLVPVAHAITKGKFGPSKTIEEDTPLFELLTGRKPKGTVISQYVWLGKGRSQLHLSDDTGTLKLKIQFNDENDINGFSVFTGDGEVFRRARQIETGAMIDAFGFSFGYTTVGLIKTETGIEIPILFEMNAINTTSILSGDLVGPMRIRGFINGKTTDIFTQGRTMTRKN